MLVRKTIILSTLFLLFALPTFAQQKPSSGWYLPLLLDDDPQVVTAGVRIVHNGYFDDEQATDIIASRLFNEVSLAKEATHKDLVAWYAKALGKSRKLKYRDLLLYAKKRADRSKSFRYISDALKELNIAAEDEFNPNLVNISYLRIHYINRNSSYTPPNKSRFDHITQAMSVEALFKLIGTPFNVGLLSTTYHRYAKTDEIVCHYPGVGLVFLKPINALMV